MCKMMEDMRNETALEKNLIYSHKLSFGEIAKYAKLTLKKVKEDSTRRWSLKDYMLKLKNRYCWNQSSWVYIFSKVEFGEGERKVSIDDIFKRAETYKLKEGLLTRWLKNTQKKNMASNYIPLI